MTSFTVPLAGAPKGSRTIGISKSGKAFSIEASKRTEPFMAVIQTMAQAVGVERIDGPVAIRLVFVFPRPKAHYGTGRNARTLKKGAPQAHAQQPDLDKLVRAVLDALTYIAWRDDAQVVDIGAIKLWGEHPETRITLWHALGDGNA